MIPVITSLCVFIFIGYIFMNSFSLFKTYTFYAKLAYAYGIGVGIISIEMLLFSMIRISWNPFYLVLPWIFIFCIQLFQKKIAVPDISFTFPKKLLDKILVLSILMLFIFVCFEAWLRPVSGWDAFATWLMAGKAYYFEGYIKPSLFTYFNFDSPPLISVMVTFFYIIGGNVNDKFVLLLFSFFYISLITMFYYTVKKYTTTRMALMYSFLLASTQLLIRQAGRYDVGYADLPLAYYFFASTALFLQYVQSKKWQYAFFASLFAGLSLLVKNEGETFFIFMTICILFQTIQSKRYLSMFVTLIGLSIFATWNEYRHVSLVSQNYLHQGKFILSRAPQIVLEDIKELLNISRWNLGWVTFGIALWISKYSIQLRYILVLITAQFATYFFIFLITPLPFIEHMHGSLDRLLLHIFPLSLLFIAVAYQSYNKR